MMRTILSKFGWLLLSLFLPCLAHGQRSNLVADRSGPISYTPITTSSPDSAMPMPKTEDPVARPRVSLFLHLDKTIYQSGESIWFTGYVLNRERDLMQKQNTLYVTVVDAVNRVPAIKQRFLIRSGIGKGSIALPDTLNAGDYWLIAYTNTSLESDNQPIFRQLISLRGPIAPPFSIIGQSIDTGATNNGIRIHYKIGTSYNGLASGGKFSYTIFADCDSIGAGQQTIDPFGEVALSIDTTKELGRKLELTATITRDDLSRNFILSVATPSSAGVSLADQQDAALQQSPIRVVITPDSTEYHKRSGVTLHVRITDSAGRPLQGIFSLSVAASKRVDPARTGNITHFSPSPNPLTSAAFVSSAPNSPDFGYVTYLDKKPQKPVPLALMGNQLITFESDSFGRFELPYNILVAPQGSTNYLSVACKSSEDYKITVCSKGDRMDDELASFHYPLNFSRQAVTSDSDELKIQSSPGMLRAALVKAKVQEEYNAFVGEYHSRNCDEDYVCTHHHGPPQLPGFLNCPDVTVRPCATTKPVEGGRYLYLSKADWHGKVAGVPYVIYHCAVPSVPAFMVPLKPILLSTASFRLHNYSSMDSTLTAGSTLQSTVYWSHLLSTNEQGEATIDFYTNDLTGKFVCILQGISTEGAIFGKGSYIVTP